MDWGERNAGGSMFCRGEGVGNESDNGKTCTTHPHRDTQTVILLDHRLSMPHCKSCCSFQSHTCTLTACHTYTHTHTWTHTHRGGVSVLIWAVLSVSQLWFLFQFYASKKTTTVFLPSFSFSQTNSCLSDTRTRVHGHTHTHKQPSECTDEFPWLNYCICQSNSLLFLRVLHLVTRGFVLCGWTRQ